MPEVQRQSLNSKNSKERQEKSAPKKNLKEAAPKKTSEEAAEEMQLEITALLSPCRDALLRGENVDRKALIDRIDEFRHKWQAIRESYFSTAGDWEGVVRMEFLANSIDDHVRQLGLGDLADEKAKNLRKKVEDGRILEPKKAASKAEAKKEKEILKWANVYQEFSVTANEIEELELKILEEKDPNSKRLLITEQNGLKVQSEVLKQRLDDWEYERMSSEKRHEYLVEEKIRINEETENFFRFARWAEEATAEEIEMSQEKLREQKKILEEVLAEIRIAEIKYKCKTEITTNGDLRQTLDVAAKRLEIQKIRLEQVLRDRTIEIELKEIPKKYQNDELKEEVAVEIEKIKTSAEGKNEELAEVGSHLRMRTEFKKAEQEESAVKQELALLSMNLARRASLLEKNGLSFNDLTQKNFWRSTYEKFRLRRLLKDQTKLNERQVGETNTGDFIRNHLADLAKISALNEKLERVMIKKAFLFEDIKAIERKNARKRKD